MTISLRGAPICPCLHGLFLLGLRNYRGLCSSRVLHDLLISSLRGLVFCHGYSSRPSLLHSAWEPRSRIFFLLLSFLFVSVCFGWSSVCFGSIETPKLAVSVWKRNNWNKSFVSDSAKTSFGSSFGCFESKLFSKDTLFSPLWTCSGSRIAPPKYPTKCQVRRWEGERVRGWEGERVRGWEGYKVTRWQGEKVWRR